MGKTENSGSVRQYHADLAQQQFLLVGHDQKLESAAQTVAITHHRSQLHNVRRERNGKLHGNNFAGLQRTAESRSDAVVAELIGSAPAGGGQAVAKHRHLNAHVKTITGEPPQLRLSFACRWFGWLNPASPFQFSLSKLGLRFDCA